MKVVENRILPNKYYWFGIGFITVLSSFFVYLRGWEGLVLMMFAVYLFLEGMGKQEKYGPDQVQ